jgi:ribosomal protein L7/L12
METNAIDRNEVIVLLSKHLKLVGEDDAIGIAHNNSVIRSIQTVMGVPAVDAQDKEDKEFEIVRSGLSLSGNLAKSDIYELLKRSKNQEKLMAIKRYKELTAIGLKDAKEEFDEIFRKLGV